MGSAAGMAGAGVLAASAALKGGAGKVWLGFAQNSLPIPYLPNYPEIMITTAAQLVQRRDISVYAIGCGLGMSDASRQLLEQTTAAAIHTDAPLLLDADALNLLAVETMFLPNNVVLTPHPLEAARLLGITVEEVQGNRYLAASNIAERYGSYVVLKGAKTLVCTPDGRIVSARGIGPIGLTAGEIADAVRELRNLAAG